MPRLGTCAACGKTMQLGKGSRTDVNVCRECRRKEPGKYKNQPRTRPNKPRTGPNKYTPRPSQRKYYPTPCAECGQTFQPREASHRLCSRSCAAKVRARAGGRARWPISTLSARDRKKAAVRARRLRIAATWDGVTDRQIHDRDRWHCWICDQPISKTIRWPHPQSASIDHLIPLSLGGDDTAGNKHSAHLGCNLARQTGRPGEVFPPGFSPLPSANAEHECNADQTGETHKDTTHKKAKTHKDGPCKDGPPARTSPAATTIDLWWTTVRPLTTRTSTRRRQQTPAGQDPNFRKDDHAQ